MRNLILAVFALAIVPASLLAQDDTPAKGGDEALEAWIKSLTEKIAVENETIRRSVQAAVVAVGQPAIPHLQKVAKSEGKASEEAQRLISRIERAGQRRQPGGGEDGGGRGARGGAFGGGRFLEQLGLSEDQQKKVDEFNESRAKSMADMREKLMNGEMTREDFREVMSKQREEQNAKMKEILTEDQMKKYEEMMENFRGGRGQGGRGQGGRGQGGRGGRGQGGGGGQIEEIGRAHV